MVTTEEVEPMAQVNAGITTSLDGYIVGPNDGRAAAWAMARAREAAGDKDVYVMGGADVIRQALRGGYVEELSISIAPVVLGGGKRLFYGFDDTLNLEHVRLLQSPFATHITYRVLR